MTAGADTLETIRDGPAPQWTTQSLREYEQAWGLWRALCRDDRLTDEELAAWLTAVECRLRDYGATLGA